MFNDFILPSCMNFYAPSTTVCTSRFQDTNFLLLNIQIEEKNAEMEKNCRLSYLNREMILVADTATSSAFLKSFIVL